MGQEDVGKITNRKEKSVMSSLEGKVALVTGGNSGIGLATAREFHANGAKVVISGRDRETLEEVSRQLGHDVLAVQANWISCLSTRAFTKGPLWKRWMKLLLTR